MGLNSIYNWLNTKPKFLWIQISNLHCVHLKQSVCFKPRWEFFCLDWCIWQLYHHEVFHLLRWFQFTSMILQFLLRLLSTSVIFAKRKWEKLFFENFKTLWDKGENYSSFFFFLIYLFIYFLKRVFKSPWAITKIPRYFSWNACCKCGVTLHCRHGIIYKRTFLSCIFWSYLSFTKNCLLGVHEDTLKILACLHWFSQKGKES